MAEKYEVRRADPFAPESIRLIEELWKELGELYPEVKGAPFRPTDILGDRTGFVVAWLAGKAVGCGAFQPLTDGDPSIAEIKRMYVEPSARRRGISRAILMKLEELARRCGYLTARLETGVHQPGAIRLYEIAGYQQIERYGRHLNDRLSICFQKSLSRASGKDG